MSRRYLLPTLLICVLLAACGTEPAPPPTSGDTGETKEPSWTELQRLGKAAFKRGDFAQADLLLAHAVAQAEAENGNTSRRLETLLDTWGDAQSELGKYGAADVTYQRVLQMREALYGKESSEAARSWNDIAQNWYHKPNVARAKAAFERAKEILDKRSDTSDGDLALSLHNLGAIHFSANENAIAKELWQRALTIRLRVDGEHATSTATTIYNLAILADDERRYDESAALLQRALDDYSAAKGPDHPDVATCLVALAENACRDGRDCANTAIPQLERALAIQQRAYGQTHANLIDTLQQLARLYETSKRYDEARPLRQRALTIQKAKYAAKPGRAVDGTLDKTDPARVPH